MRRIPAAICLVFLTLHPAASFEAAVQESSPYVQLVNDSERGELVFLVGPLKLPAQTGHHMIRQPRLLTATLPVDGYLYGFEVQMVDSNMEQPISNRMLHHVNLIDPDNRELFSPVARRLFAAGQEAQPAQLPRWLGVPFERGQRLNVSAMFHNPTEIGYDEAFLRVTLFYREPGRIFPIAVYPVYLDVMPMIGKKDFDLPPGRFEKSWEGSPEISGRLLAVGGHVHKYALSIRFEDVTADKVIWESEPVIDEEGNVVAVPVGQLWKRGGVRLESDRTYRLSVTYDNPTGQTIVDGGMGAFGGVFLPARGQEWPALNPDDPMYVTDISSTRATAERRSRGMQEDEAAAAHHHDHTH